MENWPQWYRHYWMIVISTPLMVMALVNFVYSKYAVGKKAVKPE